MRKIILLFVLLFLYNLGYTQYIVDDTDTTPFEDISATGTPLGLSDDGEANVTLPFAFDFDGTVSSNVRIGANGGLLFGVTTGNLAYTNQALAGQSPRIVPFWDDLNPDTGGNVYHETRGTAPDRRFIVQWHVVPHYYNQGAGTFQLVLYETNHEIVFVYQDVDFGTATYNYGASATIGIVGTTNTHQYSYNTASVYNGDAINFHKDLPPTILCPQPIMVDNDPGICGAVVTFVDAIATDLHDGVVPTMQTQGLPSGSTFPVGDTTVEYSATDSDGNTVTCQFTVTINDTEDPIITCPADITQNNDPGICGAIVNYTVPVGTDNCGINTQEYITNGDFETGDYSGWTTFTDGSATFNINDGTFVPDGPSGALPPISGSYDLITNQTSSSLTLLSQPLTVPYNVQDAVLSWLDRIRSHAAFNNYSQVFRVEILDAAMNPIQEIFSTNPGDPTIQIGPNVRSYNLTALIQSLEGQMVYLRFNQNTQDYFFNVNLDDISFEISNVPTTLVSGLASGSEFPVGTTTNTYEVIDGAGNTATCSFDVTVIDNEGPVITCPANITQDNDPGICGAIVNYTTPVGTDNCSGTTVQIAGLASGDTFPIGTTTNTFEVTDPAGNTASCSFDVTVNDTEDPVIACPANITQDNDSGLCGAVVTYTVPVGTDNCPGASTVQIAGLASGDMFPVGTTTNTYEVTDAAGLTASCSFDVTVNDTEDPVITCPADITVNNDPGVCEAVVSYVVTATDNCSFFYDFETGGAGWTTGSLGGANNWQIRTTSGTGTSFGANMNMYGVPHSGSGTYGTEYSYLLSPVFNSTGGGTFFFDFFVNNEPSVWDQEIVQVSYDGGSSWTQVIGPQLPNNATTVQSTSFTISSANGTSNTVVRFVYNTVDNCCGTQDGFFVDNIEFGLTIAQTDSTGLTSGDAFPVGTTTLEYTATDAAGNTDICSFDVTVEDNEPPVAICQDITVELDANGLVSITEADINNGSTDNCAIDTLVLDITSFDCTNLGPNTVVLTVTDIHGNPSTCTATVTVEDNINPVAVCQDFTLELDGNGLGTITTADIDGGSSDNCDIDTMVLDITSFDCSNLGPNTVALTVTDTSGNTDSCTATVTVVDIINPVAVCQDFTISLNAIGEASITTADIDGGSTDNCDIDFMTLDKYDFGCDDVGVNTVELTVTDTSGNTDSCFAEVTIIDLPPVIACPTDVVADSQPGVCGSEVFFPNASALDPEGGVVVITQTMGPVSGSVFPIGETIVEFSATDFCGVNVTTCQFTITVNDVEDPVAMCQDITVELDAGGMVSITEADIDNGSADNCGGFTLALDMSSFDCGDVGENMVTLTVTDASGNTDTCTATVTVEDNQAPVVICMGGGGAFNVLQEFEAASIPGGWSTVIESGSWDWTFGSGAMPGTDDFPTNAAIFDDDAAGTGTANHARLLSPVYSLVGADAATLSFDYALGDFAGSGKLTVEIWDGAGWYEIFVADDADIPPTNTGVIDVLAYANTATQFRFSYDDENGGWNWGAGVDNFMLDYNIPPTPPLEVVLDPDGVATVDAMDLLFSVDDNCGTVATFGSGGGVSGSLTTLFAAGNNGSPGGAVYFDVTVGPTDITLNSIDINTADAGAFTMDVYALMGTYVGNEGNAGAWGTPVNASGTGAGLDMPSNAILDTPVVLTAGNTYGMALVLDATHAHHYTNGDGSNESFSNADLTMDLGAASNVPFDGSPFSPRVFNGTLHYETGGGATMDFDCSMLGENSVEVTVTDAGGNEATCTATVIVLDETAPVIVCGPEPTLTGSVSVSPGLTIDTNGSDVIISSTITVADDYTILDMNVPVDITHTWIGDIVMSLTSPAGTTVMLHNGTGGSAQDIVTTYDDEGDAPASPLSAFDGESTMGVWTLDIEDTFPGLDGGMLNSWGLIYEYANPNADLFIELGADGTVTIEPMDVLSTLEEACEVDVMLVDITDFTCDDIGAPILVTVFVNDTSGNPASCQVEVNIVDNMEPTLTCPGNTVAPFDPATGTYILPDYFDIGDAFATDNCTDVAMLVLTQDPAPGTQMPATTGSPHVVTFTAEDEYGNIATCVMELTVGVVGVEENELLASALTMYPNPATDQVTLVNSSTIALEAAVIYDINGKLVVEIDLQNMQKETTFDVSNFASGVYMVKIFGENANTVKRLIKK